MPALSSLDLAGVARFLLSPECKSVSILTGAGVSVATPARPAAAAAMASRALVTWTISLAVREVAVSPLRRSLCFPPATRGDGEHYHALWTIEYDE